jgi:transglutaminase-like putative cysteine protease
LRIILFWAACLLALPGLASSPDVRVFKFSYEVLPTDFPADQSVDIYLPIPRQDVGQRILAPQLESSLLVREDVDSLYGNGYYHLHRGAGNDQPISVTLSWVVERGLVTASGAGDDAVGPDSQYLASNTLVPVGHDVLQPILAEIHQMRSDDSPAATARAIYDWVVDNVEYKKVGTGWGNGDTFWACSERYGNCTDFHALFVALARTEGIPARFEIGFPVPLDRTEGDIGGYHCWVQFYLPERGWVPIDASEAAKHPQHREALYGSHPADRIHFTTGRDIVVSQASEEAPLNYFIYPYVEIGGKPWKGRLQTRFSFKEVALP